EHRAGTREMSSRIKESQGQEMVLTGAVAIAVLLLSLLPMLRLVREIILPGGNFSTAAIDAGLANPATWTATWHTIVVGVGGTLLSVFLGTLIALVVTLTDMRGRGPFILFYVLPLMIAPQVTALAWLQLFGPASPFLKMVGLAPPLGTRNPLSSTGGIILLLGIQYGPLVFLLVRAGLRKLPRELVEAARAGGAGWFTVLRTVILPLMTPSIVAAAALAFVSCVGNFGIPAFLGIPANYLVLPTLIYQRLAGAGPAVLGETAFLSLLIGMIAMAGIVTQEAMSRRRDFRITATSLAVAPFRLGRWRLITEIAAWFLILIVLVLPIIGLTLSALVPAYGVPLNFSTMTLDNFRFVMFAHGASARAFSNSIALSLAAALFA